MWESLAIRLLREQEIAGSNPAIPTVDRDDSGGARAGTSARLLTGTTQVRFLPPQLDDAEGQAEWATAPGSKPVER